MEDLLASRVSDKEDKMALDKVSDKMDSDNNKDLDHLSNRIHQPAPGLPSSVNTLPPSGPDSDKRDVKTELNN